MAERFLLTYFDEQPNGDLLKVWVREVSTDDVLRMHGINPDEYWSLSLDARQSVHTHMNAGIGGAEAVAQVQSMSSALN